MLFKVCKDHDIIETDNKPAGVSVKLPLWHFHLQ